MSCLFNNNPFKSRRCNGFTITEAVAAVAVLAIIVTSILTVFQRCSQSAMNSTIKTQAFEVARENMETLLASEKVTEQSDYGFSDKYPNIEWTNKVEAFTESATKKMWVRAVCSAEYEDASGQLKQVELTHWITKLTEKQAQKVKADNDKLKSFDPDGENDFPWEAFR